MSETDLSRAIERAIRRGTGARTIGEVDSIQAVWGGNGEVLRVELEGAEVQRVIVKRLVVPAGAKKKKRKDASLARTLTSYDNELVFYLDYSGQLPDEVRTPRCFGAQKLDDGWVFVLEDLRDSGFLALGKNAEPQQIEAALGWLAGFHAAFLGHPGAGLWKTGSYWNRGAREAEHKRMTNERLKGAAAALDRALNECRFKTLIHGDTKTDNFCFDSAGEAAGLDFQYVGQGCAMKDLMCLLDSSVDSYELQGYAPQYVDLYFTRLRQALARRASEVSADDVEREWRSLYPLAWADYYRFLDGWAPGKYPPEGYVDEMCAQAFSYLATLGS